MALSKQGLTLTSGLIVVRETDSGSTSNDNVTGTTAVVYLLSVNNGANASTSVYLKLYNHAAPTVGTTAPELVLKAAGGQTSLLAIPNGHAFSTGLSFATVSDGGGTAGTTSPVSDVIVTIVTT